MKKVLWISLLIPYDKVRHAGGKIHNFYLKALKKTNQFDIRLLTFAQKSDMLMHDLEEYGISHDIICYDSAKTDMVFRKIINAESTYNPYNRYGRALQNYDILKIHHYLRKYRREGYQPDVIILQWTQISFMLPYVKKSFPDATVITIEEDVTYLSYQRKMQVYPNTFLRYISKVSYKRVKKLELAFLEKADLIILNNHKDEKLIIDDGIKKDKTFVWVPFFQNYLSVDRCCENHNIIFYGGMGRQENYLSAIWFAEKVMPRLMDMDVNFLIIGANPDKRLYAYASDRIQVVGYVEQVEKYLSRAMCMVAPLVFGAGIKIKILESLSAGIPVLTNDVGIEGIQAEDGKEFFYCVTEEDYEKCIRRLLSGEIDMENMSRREKDFIRNHYNLDKSLNDFVSYIDQL